VRLPGLSAPWHTLNSHGASAQLWYYVRHMQEGYQGEECT